MRTASISIDGVEIARASIRDDVAEDQLAITVLKAIRDVPAPRKTRRDKGKRKQQPEQPPDAIGGSHMQP